MNADWLPDETPVRSLCSHGVHALRNDGRRIFGRIGARTSISGAYEPRRVVVLASSSAWLRRAVPYSPPPSVRGLVNRSATTSGHAQGSARDPVGEIVLGTRFSIEIALTCRRGCLS
jgi:hypothetical protein